MNVQLPIIRPLGPRAAAYRRRDTRKSVSTNRASSVVAYSGRPTKSACPRKARF